MPEQDAAAQAVDAVFADPIRRWRLIPDGPSISTHSSRLLPVIADGAPAMLKVALEPEERRGAATMAWWAGDGAARVLGHDGDALLLERAIGARSLAAMARGDQDDDATRIMCGVATRLHASRDTPLPSLTSLPIWFEPLLSAGAGYGGPIAEGAGIARRLLATPEQEVVLHGDIHHDNILDFGDQGWLAIDPKGLIGERAFDFANIFRDPDLEVALRPGRLARQADLIAERVRLDRRRLLEWVAAFCALSAVWILEDGDDPDIDRPVLDLALAALAKT